MGFRTNKFATDPNHPDYAVDPMQDPGHTHSAASVVSVGRTGAAFSSPAVTSGTAFQCSTTADADLYIVVNTSAAVAVSMGPTSGASDVIVASEAVALGSVYLRVPVGWWVKITGTIADLTISQVV